MAPVRWTRSTSTPMLAVCHQKGSNPGSRILLPLSQDSGNIDLRVVRIRWFKKPNIFQLPAQASPLCSRKFFPSLLDYSFLGLSLSEAFNEVSVGAVADRTRSHRHRAKSGCF